MTVSQQVDAFLTFLRDTQRAYAIAETTEKEADNATQDILHALELQDHTDEELLDLARRLTQARRDRREAKDCREETTPVLEYTANYAPEVKHLEALLGNTRRIERNHQNRVYIPKSKGKS